MSDTHSLTDTLAAFFKAKPEVWIDGHSLEGIAGRYAWRSRVSDCRTKLGMDIRNRQQRMTDAHGRTWTVSWYAYFPAPERVPVTEGHDLNAVVPDVNTGRLW